MSKDDNRRQHDRFSADDVRGNFSYSVEASVLNISLGGLAVRTQSQLSIGRKYRFRLGGFANAVDLSGSVRWCRMSGTERQESGDIVPVYDAGIAFDEVLTEKAEELLVFMEKNIVLSPKRRISGRFKLDSVDQVVLESDSAFEVREISVSGMMIEADVALKPETALELEMRLGRLKFTSLARIIYMSEIDLHDGDLSYRMGVEFLETAPEQKEKLEKFIRTELKKAGEDPGPDGDGKG
jgi:c-di-GMP-binding flagellar brake protein YcgR